MIKNLSFFYKQLADRLWFRPLVFCLLSIAGALIAHLADDSFLVGRVPDIEKKSIEELLTTLSATMLVIAIFAVSAMLSAFSSASGSATPRSFRLIVADDVSQNALSVFIGSFIYSIVATIALQNGFYGEAGYFVLFVLTLAVFVLVILTFLRWVERISKLGRMGHTIKKVEEATLEALSTRKKEPHMGGLPVSNHFDKSQPIWSDDIGYVRHINLSKLQKWGEDHDVQLTINCLPGAFAAPDKPLVYISNGTKSHLKKEIETVQNSFIIGDSRSFHDDPRFGFIALTEIASRALSPGINDPGTAIAIINSHVRLFNFWVQKNNVESKDHVAYDRLAIPEILLSDLFEDAFRPIARDGANNIEVMIRLQKALKTIASVGTAEVMAMAATYSQSSFERSKNAMELEGDIEILQQVCLSNNN